MRLLPGLIMLPCHSSFGKTSFVHMGEVVLDSSCKCSITGETSIGPVIRSDQYRMQPFWAILRGQVTHMEDALLFDCFIEPRAASRMSRSAGPGDFSPLVATFSSVGQLRTQRQIETLLVILIVSMVSVLFFSALDSTFEQSFSILSQQL